MNRIKNCEPLMRVIKSLKESNLEFITVDSRTMVTDHPWRPSGGGKLWLVSTLYALSWIDHGGDVLYTVTNMDQRGNGLDIITNRSSREWSLRKHQ